MQYHLRQDLISGNFLPLICLLHCWGANTSTLGCYLLFIHGPFRTNLTILIVGNLSCFDSYVRRFFSVVCHTRTNQFTYNIFSQSSHSLRSTCQWFLKNNNENTVKNLGNRSTQYDLLFNIMSQILFIAFRSIQFQII